MVDVSRSLGTAGAGWDALAKGAWQEARAHFDAAVCHHDDAEALEGLSWATWWLEDIDACIDARERAYRAYRDAGDNRSATRMALWLSDDHADLRGEPAVAEGWFSRATRLAADLDPCPEKGWLAVFEAHAALDRDDLDLARRLAADAVEVGRRHRQVDLEMFAVATSGIASLRTGEVGVGLRQLSEAATAALAGEYENLVPASWSCCLLIAACEDRRDYDRAAQWCEQIAAFSERAHARFLRGVCNAHYGAILTWRGRLRDAETVLVSATGSLSERRPTWRPEALVRLGELRRLQGQQAEAIGLFEAAGAHPLAQRGLAAVRLDQGDPVGARDLLERMLRQLPSEHGTRRSDALELLVRAELALGELESARAHAEELRSIAGTVGTSALRASANVAAGRVALASDDNERACDRFEDAIDLLLRDQATLEAAAVRVELAGALEAVGRPEAAVREARTALATLEEIRPVERERATAVLKRCRGEDLGNDTLTTRQLEVLRLIAEGLSDHEIAERLVLSQHTVHRHVANIYTRLGCSTRAAAIARAIRLGIL
jgi:LuxR family transcriptional regulator, maltose regulon positive regulatory protein